MQLQDAAANTFHTVIGRYADLSSCGADDKKKMFVCLQLFATLFLCTKAWYGFADGRSTVKESPDCKSRKFDYIVHIRDCMRGTASSRRNVCCSGW